ncbi:unnamed protein product, partial [Ceratitis capitata]
MFFLVVNDANHFDGKLVDKNDEFGLCSSREEYKVALICQIILRASTARSQVLDPFLKSFPHSRMLHREAESETVETKKTGSRIYPR